MTSMMRMMEWKHECQTKGIHLYIDPSFIFRFVRRGSINDQEMGCLEHEEINTNIVILYEKSKRRREGLNAHAHAPFSGTPIQSVPKNLSPKSPHPGTTNLKSDKGRNEYRTFFDRDPHRQRRLQYATEGIFL